MLDLHEEIPSVEFAHQSISKMDTLSIWIQAWVQVEITMDKGKQIINLPIGVSPNFEITVACDLA